MVILRRAGYSFNGARMRARVDSPTIPLRRHLITLVVVAVVPMLLFAFAMVAVFGWQQRHSTERELQRVTQTLTLAVDRELDTSLRALETLAASPYLDRSDVASFYELVERAMHAQPRWRAVVLTDAAGTVQLVSSRPPGTATGSSADQAYFKALLATRKPVFSELIIDRSTPATPVIDIAVPVLHAGSVRYTLAAALDLNALSQFMAAETLPSQWTATIVDRKGTVLARSREPERWFGRPAAAVLWSGAAAALATGDDDGVPSYVAQARVASAGWTVAVSVPTNLVDAPLRRALAAALAAGLLVIAIGALLARTVGRRLARPIEALVESAEALGRGETITPVPARIAEVARLSAAIVTASTERERVEHALRASEAQLRAIFTSALDAIVVADADGRYVDCNPAAEELFGLPRVHLLGRGVQEFAASSEDAESRWRAFLQKGSARGLFRLRRPDGTERDVEFSATADVIPGRHVSVLRDVTARREAEDELRRRERESTMLAELTQRMNARLDLERILLAVCESARELCGADGATIALRDPQNPDAMTLRQRVARNQVPLPSEPIVRGRGLGGRVMELGRPLRSDDYAGDPSIAPDYTALGDRLGTRSVIVVPIHVDARVEGLLYVANITRRPFGDRDEAMLVRLAEQAASAIRNARLLASEQQARAESDDANRAKDEFLATLSHELRTPLTSMLGWVRMLRSARLDTDQRTRALETIERNTRLQAKLIDDLLDVSRIVAGKIKVEQQRVDLGAVVADVVQSLRGEADGAGVILDVTLAPDVPPVIGDATRLQQVVGNLLSNAIKFTPPGGRVAVVLHAEDARVRLVVQDSGAGIAADLLPHVFDRFLQGDGSRTRGRGGLGLGLAIARHLVELHGGAIVAASEGPGRGATFTVELPAARGTAGEDRAPAIAPHRAGRALDGMRVLVVEDHDDSRELIHAALRERGADVRTARSVDEALDALEREPVDLLISDVGMPHRDGYALITALRELERTRGRPPLPAVALTAFATRDDRDRLLAAGFQLHVAKPIDPDTLEAAVAGVLAGHEPRRPG
jgi:PAS domain S-box-containing protein